MSNWKRLTLGVLASLVLVGAFALTGGMKNGSRTDGLLYQASGLHPDGELLVVDGQTVTCEEYLYWLDMDCQYLASQIADIDWTAQVTEDGMTYAQYAKADALESVKLYSVVRRWAQEAGITLTEADQAELEQQRQEYVTYYGGEEGYLRQLELAGLTQELFDANNETALLYRQLYQQFRTPGSALYPDDGTLSGYARQQGLMTAQVITLAGENAETMAGDLLERWQTAEDPDGEYSAICQELAQEAAAAVTLTAQEGDGLSDAVAALRAGEFAAVIDPYGDGTCYLVRRQEDDLSAVAELYFDVLLEQRRENAAVVVNEELYDAIDVGAFAGEMTSLRAELYRSMQEDAS